jgi:uncharacterized membrane protein
MLKVVLAVLAGTLTFSFSLLRRLNSSHVPNVGVTVAGGLVVVSLVLFLFFLDRFIHRLRPVAVAGLVGRAGRQIFTSLAEALKAETAPSETAPADIAEHDPVLVIRSGTPAAWSAGPASMIAAWYSRAR